MPTFLSPQSHRRWNLQLPKSARSVREASSAAPAAKRRRRTEGRVEHPKARRKAKLMTIKKRMALIGMTKSWGRGHYRSLIHDIICACIILFEHAEKLIHGLLRRCVSLQCPKGENRGSKGRHQVEGSSKGPRHDWICLAQSPITATGPWTYAEQTICPTK